MLKSIADAWLPTGKQPTPLPRGYCHYTSIDLSDIPVKQRREALRLKLKSWTPYHAPGFEIVVTENVAQIWCFACDASDHIAQFAPVESRLQARPVDNGVVLVRCLEGFDGQVWRNGILRASRWWEREPDQVVWQWFLRGAGLPPQPCPQPKTPVLLNKPWGRTLEWRRGDFGRWEVRAWWLLALMSAALVGYQIAQAYRLSDLRTELLDRQASFYEANARVLDARAQAEVSLQRLTLLRQLWARPSQIALLHEVLKRLPDSDMEIIEWTYSEGSLVVLLRGATLRPTEIVRALSAPEWAQGVRVEPTRARDEQRVSLRVQL